jgi:tetratricopeptide (TPR) repeat protein
VRRIHKLSIALALSVAALSAPARATDGLAGPYLAGRLAGLGSDYVAASDYFDRALAADPGNPQLIENLIIGEIGRGRIDKAAAIATEATDGEIGQIADLVVLADMAKRGDFAGAIAALDAGKSGGGLVDGLYRAWALVGQGQMSEATLAFDKVSESAGLKSFGLYHKALALAAAGDFEAADAIFSGDAGGPLRATRRGVIAHAEVLSQLERNADAVELIDKVFGQTDDTLLVDLRARLDAGETLPFTLVTDATSGISEVFLSVASALVGETTDINALAYARMAEYLSPGLADAHILCAQILDAQGQHDLASETYKSIARDDPAYGAAELGRADSLIAAERWDAAIEVLEKLSKDMPARADIWISLGDIYRRRERFDEAANTYSKAIDLFKSEEPRQWVVYYTRGIAYERLKDWPQAEADFLKALALNPDQPSVLNYLGYSYLERKERYDEALSMIERAVAAQPENGAIVDSLGWALFRLGRYDEAVVQMEQAVELMPVDPVVNDHLGDVYWAVGRQREASFQWRRALSFEPDTEEDAARIRRKIEVGLDKVLKEEGAEPLAVSTNGG